MYFYSISISISASVSLRLRVWRANKHIAHLMLRCTEASFSSSEGGLSARAKAP